LSGWGGVRGRLAALGTVIACVLAGGTWIALTRTSAQASGPGADPPGHHATSGRTQSGPLRVVSVTPSAGTTNANGADPVRVTFSAALSAGSPMPILHPAIAGSWRRVSANVLQFQPSRGFGEHVRVRLQIPGGPSGVRSASGTLARSLVVRFRTGRYSVLRVDQLLAQLGYLPLTWTPASGSGSPAAADAQAQHSAAFAPPAGTFTWQPGYPKELRRFWHGGRPGSLILKGAVMAFESQHGMTLDGVVGPAVWKAMFAAVQKGQSNVHGYTYARASQKTPETLTIWHNGRKVLRSLANTGIPVSPTAIATNPVYLRYRFQIMKGTNPDGSQYADPVDFVSYFNAGEAVHYFPRGGYGYQQSLGCVELPWGAAAKAWPYLTYGSLVTVTAP
jgi:peptidoglycan hydrolase-like protein with peptidoglycan-binding domain